MVGVRYGVARASVGESREARTAGCGPAGPPITRVAAIPPARAEAGITVSQFRYDAYAAVTADSRIGPPVESLFKPLYRLGAERLVGGEGAGLGLPIVRSVAEAHGGTVAATPRPGGGLEIRVSLPVDPE